MSLKKDLQRYVFAAFGPMAVSLVHFAASLLLLRLLAPQDFGIYAFMMVAVQFGFSLSNALAGTPFTVKRNQTDFFPDDELPFFRVSLLIALGWALSCAIAAMLLGPAAAALPIAVWALLAIIRWFCRSYFYALHKPGRAVLSDAAYAATLLAGLAWFWMYPAGLPAVFTAFSVAAAAGLATAGPHFITRQFAALATRGQGSYVQVWRDQSRWTLLGVASTEATTNAHAWLVTLLAGPAAFAPLAASALLFRPTGLCATSLTQLERPVMARALSRGDRPAALRAMRHFRFAMLAVWAGTATLAFSVLFWTPSLIVREGYDMRQIMIAAALWAAVTFLQAWRVADSTLLQAASRFRPLATASLWSGTATLAAVMTLLLFLDPVLSLLGVLAGQLVLAWRIKRLFQMWRQHE
ncbi:MAG: hypothetical protein ACK4K8_06450 [Pannonibacter sp.]